VTTRSVTFAPGSRLLIRDEEWLVKSTLPVRNGRGVAVRVVGLSELVRNHEAIFLSELDDIAELKPEETKLVPDDSPQDLLGSRLQTFNHHADLPLTISKAAMDRT